MVGAYPNLARICEGPYQRSKVIRVITDKSGEKPFMIDPQSVSAKVEKNRDARYEWLIFEELFQQSRSKVPLLKTVTPMTPICVSIFAGNLPPAIVSGKSQGYFKESKFKNRKFDLRKEPENNNFPTFSDPNLIS